MPNAHRIELVGQDVIAHDLGVSSQAISNWFAREARDIEAGKPGWGLPVPTLVQYSPGKRVLKTWRESQRAVWAKWYARHLARTGHHIRKDNRPRVAA